MKKLILIDDDSLIHLIWREEASKCGYELMTYTSPFEFLNEKETHNERTPIFIDSHLNLDMKGEEFAKMIFEEGFENIHLISAYTQIDLQNYPWLKSIKTKRPNFSEIK